MRCHVGESSVPPQQAAAEVETGEAIGEALDEGQRATRQSPRKTLDNEYLTDSELDQYPDLVVQAASGSPRKRTSKTPTKGGRKAIVRTPGSCGKKAHTKKHWDALIKRCLAIASPETRFMTDMAAAMLLLGRCLAIASPKMQGIPDTTAATLLLGCCSIPLH